VSLLIPEPPLIVLPSLARELGLVDAIVLQQLYYAGARTPDGWVRRSNADWSRAMRGAVAARTLERLWGRLLKAEWIEEARVAGEPTAYRVTPRRLREGSAIERGDPPAASGGSVSRENSREETPSPKAPSKKRILDPKEEPVGFGTWLSQHVDECARYGIERAVPKAGTSYRSELARSVAGLLEEGWSLEDLRLASIGVLADEFMRREGHTKPENVVRKTKIGGRIDQGRAELARRDEGYGAFDGDDPRG